jgi:PAS domain S-box-containing protein
VLFENSPDAVFLTVPDGRVVSANAAACTMFGMSEEEIIRVGRQGLIAPDDPRLAALMDQRRRTGRVGAEELEHVRKNGERFMAEVDSVILPGETQQSFVILRDITERKRAEEALTRSEQWFRSVVEHTQDALLIDDTAGRILFVNDRFLDLVGVSREEFSNLRMEVYIAPEFLQKLRDRHEARMRGVDQPTHFEYQGLRRDGKRLWLEVDVAVIRDEKGEITNTQSTIRDITDRKQAEDVLRYQAKLLDNIFDAIVSTDASFRVKTWNKGAERIYGWAAEEAIGKHPDVLFQSEFVGISKEEAYRQLMEKGFSESEVIHRDRHGRKVVIHANVTLLKNERGDIGGTLGVLRDVTERKEAQESLRESEERLRLAIEAGGLAYWEIDLTTGEVIPSRRLREMFGLSPISDRELREHWRPRFHEEDRQRVRQAVDDSARGVPCRIQYRIRTPDGSVRWQQCQAMPIPDSAGKFTRLIGMVADITDHKQAEEALRKAKDELEQRVVERTAELSRSQARLDTIFRASPAGIFLAELEDGGRVLEVNDACPRLIGYQAQDVVGRRSTDLNILVNPDDRRRSAEMLKRDGRVENMELQYRHKSGEIVVVLLNALPVDMDGVPCILGTILDITQRKRAEEQLKEANLGLERSASRLRALTLELTRVEQRERRRIAELLHDHLQQLLVAAKLNIAALSQDRLEEKQRDSAGRAMAALDQAIMQSKSLAVELNPPILREGGLAYGLQWLGRSMRQTHGMAVEVEAQDTGAHSDQEVRIMLFNAVRELLLNVLKHANVKSARVEMSMLPGHQIRVVVSDRGCGFARKVSGSANEVESGLGLLAIRERLESLGGAMEVESHPGQGSRITLTAPFRPSDEPERTSPTRRANVRSGRTAGPGGKSDAARKTIRVLLVDDHAIVRQGVAHLLSGVPEFTVVAEASSGKEAVQLTQELRPDVVVMDVNMPEMNGVEATRAIHAQRPDVFVVGLSMYNEPHRAEEMRQAGAVGYVSKSEVTETLIATIRACCKK